MPVNWAEAQKAINRKGAVMNFIFYKPFDADLVGHPAAFLTLRHKGTKALRYFWVLLIQNSMSIIDAQQSIKQHFVS